MLLAGFGDGQTVTIISPVIGEDLRAHPASLQTALVTVSNSNSECRPGVPASSASNFISLTTA